MYKRVLLLLISVVLATAAQGQDDITKKCKTCGKPLKECQYRGRHPRPDNKPDNKPASKPTKPTPTPQQAPAAKEGSIYITSDPSGAAVKLDGTFKGETPLTVEKQKPGNHTITFSKEGYESTTRSVTVIAGKQVGCDAALKKKSVPQQQTVQQPTEQSSSAATQTFTANGVLFKMIKVEGGSTGTFYMGETEVTQALWQAVMGSNPSYFKGQNRPVETVSWNDCKEFIGKLNALTGQNFRLPTEAEWEYAAKGGSKSRRYSYSGCNSEDDLELYAWYDKNAYYCGSSGGNSSHPDYGTHNVKTKRPNELGLYDMSGNVWELCEDLYSSSGSSRVLRGGSWGGYARDCRVSYRDYNDPSYRSDYNGFRLALSR